MARDARLWRYLNFEKFVWFLESSKLYHARLDQMDDPFAGSVTRAYADKRASGEILGYMPLPEPFEAINNRRLRLRSFVTCWHNSLQESAAIWKLYSTEGTGVAIVSSIGSINTLFTLSRIC